MDEIAEIKRIIDEATNIVFFGGAGVSTDSGIPDFRGGGGLYNVCDDDLDERPEDILTAYYLYKHPDKFYNYYTGNMLYPDAQPNEAHYALARLENTGKLLAVITQNIDGLHQMAGSKNVIELHGSAQRYYCVSCGRRYTLDDILNADGVPKCRDCYSLIRPDVVMYGESLDNSAFARAYDAVHSADVMIVGGTSLTVQPAASLVDEFEGEHLIIINKSETPYDDFAEYVMHDSLSDVLSKVIE